MQTEDDITADEIEDFKEGIEAIRLISERLINLAVIENNFLMLTEELKEKVRDCEFYMAWFDHKQKIIEEEYKAKFSMRYKWLEKLFFKRI